MGYYTVEIVFSLSPSTHSRTREHTLQSLNVGALSGQAHAYQGARSPCGGVRAGSGTSQGPALPGPCIFFPHEHDLVFLFVCFIFFLFVHFYLRFKRGAFLCFFFSPFDLYINFVEIIYMQ